MLAVLPAVLSLCLWEMYAHHPVAGVPEPCWGPSGPFPHGGKCRSLMLCPTCLGGPQGLARTKAPLCNSGTLRCYPRPQEGQAELGGTGCVLPSHDPLLLC